MGCFSWSRRTIYESKASLKAWATGARESVLAPYVEAYADALDLGWLSEWRYWDSVYKEYHARIDWRLKGHEEPALPLPTYDPNAIPIEEDLSPPDSIKKIERIKIVNSVSHSVM